MKKFILSIALTAICTAMTAQIKLAGVFTDNMVIQREKPVKIYGKAEPNTDVSVKFAGKSAKGKTDANGAFMLELKPLKANAKPQSLTVQTKTSKRVLNNVLIGEVWLASGQSNMEYNMGVQWRGNKSNKAVAPKHGEDLQAAAMAKAEELGTKSNPLMRLLLIEKDTKTDTLPTLGWKEIDAKTLHPMSAAAYFFAQNLIDSLNVPVGIIESAWGGTKIDSWQADKGGFRFHHMIKECVPFALRGFIWYQGCSNLDQGDIESYFDMQKKLVEGWRKEWNDNTLPFYFVELAPMEYSGRRNYYAPHSFMDLPRFRETQYRLASEVPYSGIASTIDLCDDTKDIHPTYKWEIGRRLAAIAMKNTYDHKNLVVEGPKMKGVTIDPNDRYKVIVEFDQQLKTNNGKEPWGFVVCEPLGRIIKSNATIDGNKVIITLTQKKSIYCVSYCWDEKSVSNLCGENGLPARQFFWKK